MMKYRDGSLLAFELLYTRHKGASYRYFLRQCHDLTTAEDLMQELWGRVIKSKQNYQPNALFTTWFYRIAHHLIIDHQRQFKTVESLEEETVCEQHDTPQQHVEQRELGQQLKYCLTKLPAVQLEIFLLTQETTLTIAQIAEVISSSLEATKSRLRYANKALRQCLTLKRGA